MMIDLSEWNEYIADDMTPGPIPEGVELETMQIVTASSYKSAKKDFVPTGLEADPKSIEIRMFWRVKK